MITHYQKQATDFLTETNTQFSAIFVKYDKHFPDDKERRDIYEITLQRGVRKYAFRFGQSLLHSGRYILYYDKGKYHAGDRFHTKQDLQNLRSAFIGYGKVWEENKDFEEPTPYSVLACLQKYDPDNFENFCAEFGYDTDSRKAETIYKAVKDEYQNLAMLYNDEELEQMAEIQ